ncbi:MULTISPECIES: hypothetical protein [Ancylobacter]|uniref:Uncharacterized protein n=1 Tax=Ancylobacter defluvii TaxID=1282440 RepID=A0A9W6K3F6_9HYPH|nr:MULTISPECIES: hypothetical protein [Ancylobacter]MBS7588359.1 hypothetical protein [Ancylobacter defluvii]MDR6951635.1 hypothetical protein [Ancylobacter sp. 3268]GLK86764.1 hypothetical protein GCM10017653_48340 [Ancylobacter defluvii]
MLQAEFDIVTLSPSTVRVMHRVAHHIYEFSLVDDGCGRRIVSQGPSILFGKSDQVAAWNLVAEAERVAAEVARRTGMID